MNDEEWLIEISRIEREITGLPEDTGERYDENGEIENRPSLRDNNRVRDFIGA